MKLFISYSSRDRDAVKSLAQDLGTAVKTLPTNSEFGVWFDQQLVGGHEWWSNILAAIFHADLFIFALSPASLASNACGLERMYAQRLNKRILPIIVAGDINPALLPADLQRLQFVDYRAQDKQSYQRLLEAMVRLPQPQPLPNPLPQPPEAPMSPLAQINAQLDAPTLELDVQLKLVYQLKQYLAEPDQASGARELLRRLKHHPDVRAQVAQDVAQALGQPPPLPITNPHMRPPSTAPATVNHAPAAAVSAPRGTFSSKTVWTGAGIGFVLGLIVGSQFIAAVGFDPYVGYIYYNDYSVLCTYPAVFAAIGAAAAWTYSKLKARA